MHVIPGRLSYVGADSNTKEGYIMSSPRFLLSLICTLFFVSPPMSGANSDPEVRKGELVIVEQDEVHEGWLFAAGETVSIQGTVNGDVYAAGGRILVKGIINGDLLAAGGELIISGTVSDDIRMAGGTLTINGDVRGDATVTGGSITVGEGGSVGGNILAAGGLVTIEGSIGRNARVGAGEMRVTGSIGGDLDFGGGSLSLLSGSRIEGDVVLLVDDQEQVSIHEGVVGGSVKWQSEESEEDDAAGFSPFHILMKVHWALALLLLGLIISVLFPEATNRMGLAVTGRPWHAMGWGLLTVVVFPVVAGFLLVTIIGVPLGLTLLAFFFFLLYVAQVVAGVAAGQLILRKTDLQGAALFGLVALGIIGIQLLSFIPFLGYLVCAVAVTAGLGGILKVVREAVRPGPRTAEQA